MDEKGESMWRHSMKHKMLHKNVSLVIKTNHFYFFSKDDIERRYPTGSMFWLFSIFSPRSVHAFLPALPYLVASAWVWPVRTVLEKWEGVGREKLEYVSLLLSPWPLEVEAVAAFSHSHCSDWTASSNPVALTGLQGTSFPLLLFRARRMVDHSWSL